MAEEKQDSESKIKEAARRVFLAQGYEGAKMRQIAEEASVNLAMINYYFRTKEQLFQNIYAETFAEFVGQMAVMINEPTPLEVKIWNIVDRYTDFMLANPLIPSFIISQQEANDGAFFKEINARGFIEKSVFKQQLVEEAEKGNIRPIEPLQLIVTLLGNIVFPIVARPVVSYVGDLGDEGFQEFMKSRKQIVPEMIMAYLKLR